MKKRLVYFYGLLLVMLPTLAFAASSGGSDGGTGFMSKWAHFAPTAHDQSVSFLNMIFGQMEGVFLTGGTQIMGTLLSVFNVGVLSIVSILISYSVVMSLVSTMNDGSFMLNQQKKGMWPVLRVVGGMALLLPKASGYSMIQIFVMWTVIQGIGLADMAWSTALTYFQDGGTVFSASNQQQGSGQGLAATSLNEAKMVGDIFASQVCMYRLEEMDKAKQQAASQYFQKNPNGTFSIGQGTYTAADAKPLPPAAPIYNDTNHTVTFMGPRNPNIICGTVSYAFNPDSTLKTELKDDSATQAIVQQTMRVAVAQVIADTAPAAQAFAQFDFKWYTSQQDKGRNGFTIDFLPAWKDNWTSNYASYGSGMDVNNIEIPNAFLTSNSMTIYTAAIEYRTIMLPVWMQLKGKRTKAKADWITSAKDQGWIMAASYYRAIGNWVGSGFDQADENSAGLAVTARAPTPDQIDNNTKMDIGGDAEKASFKGYIMRAYASVSFATTEDYFNAFLQHYTTYGSGNDSDLAKAFKIQLTGTDLAKHVDPYLAPVDPIAAVATIMRGIGIMGVHPLKAMADKLSAKDPVTNLMATVIQKPLNALTGAFWNTIANNQSGDMLAMLQLVGQTLLSKAADLWLAPLAALAASALAVFLFGPFLLLLVVWMIPLFMLLMAFMVTSGLMLAVYVPLIPFMLFLFAAINWIISVVEAMVAAPLIALGITHPEGHDLMGKAEQSMMLLLSVFIRPVLIIIGLLAGMVLMNVSVHLLNMGLIQIVGDSGILTNGGIANVFCGVGLVMVYMGIVLALVKQSFSMIYVVPDKVLRWIGAPAEQNDISGMLSSVKQESDQGNQMISSATKSTSESTMGDRVQKGINEQISPTKESGGGGGGGGDEGGGGGGIDVAEAGEAVAGA